MKMELSTQEQENLADQKPKASPVTPLARESENSLGDILLLKEHVLGLKLWPTTG